MINELKNLTKQYLEKGWDIERYIEELLPKEMDYLRQGDRLKTLEAEILVQLVGFSWEPLLISVCAYKPQKLILILNEFYNNQEGDARGDEYKEYIDKLKEQNLIATIPEILPKTFEPINDTPESVFKFLKKHALPFINKGKKVVIDITGAKKSMVSGAYLFASYTNCPVSYLDFDMYDEKYGRPYGYTCKINELNNPMELFKLREWSRVEELYRKYAFRSAIETINEIREGAKSFIEPEENEAIELLIKCLEFYETWDSGDYKKALSQYKKVKNQIDIPCPTAVNELGEIWYSNNDLINSIKNLEGLNDITKSIYLRDDKIIIYARDELEKIKRLIKHKEDYRSALLRAAGLSDFLLKARVIKLWLTDKLVIEMDNNSFIRKDFKNNKDLQAKIDKKLLEYAGATQIIKSLRWQPSKKKKDYVINIYGLNKDIKAHRSEDSPELEKFWEKIDVNELNLPDGIFKDLRNKAIHFCLSVSKEIAEIALEFTERNLEEFIKNWSKAHINHGIYEVVDWYDLCDKCGINFLPKCGRDKNE